MKSRVNLNSIGGGNSVPSTATKQQQSPTLRNIKD